MYFHLFCNHPYYFELKISTKVVKVCLMATFQLLVVVIN